jgi:hypothetical protein
MVWYAAFAGLLALLKEYQSDPPPNPPLLDSAIPLPPFSNKLELECCIPFPLCSMLILLLLLLRQLLFHSDFEGLMKFVNLCDFRAVATYFCVVEVRVMSVNESWSSKPHEF